MKRVLLAVLAAILLVLQGCTYYGVPATAPANFDRSFDAAAGAMRDEGVAVSLQDRASGSIAGNAGNTVIRASVMRQADGSVRVQFDSSDSRDPGLLGRISQRYDRRMGR
ncbi:hypothetical protein LMG23992_00721 [Cupriavidus laharis]|uniref:Penicillin-binding protein n=1 Tax=Cupriavidus laharis TaxID=151654 RepID=A0ABN7XYR6_9BURK|nr:hypothetical protein [Cupriavidus laharis]CAG9166234.1 hypothetical protein LMG23992_00721 [Cupriavidus laharis]